jgi:hypothetical protein
MGVDQLVTGGDVNDPVVDSLTSDSISTARATVGGDRVERVGPQQSLVAGLNNGLIGHWQLNDLSDGLSDKVGDNDILISGDPSVVTNGGAFGDGVKFSDEDYGEINHDGDLSVENSDYTISAFVRLPEGSWGQNNWVVGKKSRNSSDEATLSFAYGLIGTYSPFSLSGQDSLMPLGSIGTGSSHEGGKSGYSIGSGPLYHYSLTYESKNSRLTGWINGRSVFSEEIPDAVTGTQPVFVGSKPQSSGFADSDIIISDLRVYDEAKSQSWMRRLSRLPFVDIEPTSVTFQGRIFDKWSSPIYRYDDSKTDPHRLILKDFGDADSDGSEEDILVTASSLSADASDWTVAAEGITSGYSGFSNFIEPQDYVEESGTFYVYFTEDDSTTVVFTGSDWTSLSFDSTVVNQPDCGVWREDDGTVHIYTEDSSGGPSSNGILHYVGNSPNGSFSLVGEVIDTSDEVVGPGDPRFVEVGGEYRMFVDHTADHPYYGTAEYRSTDLYNWERITEAVKTREGGDLLVANPPSGPVGFTELQGTDKFGIGLWDVRF